ncbi:hypothetical protein Aspvir_009897 [Aspergillus viridinutans]|uniref:Fumarylacetoacetase-like C-terminal domain-containing protein n=1 Tax=Aspergillus viridinutans TaxID=75553 RepID=A0A9P3C8N2_ASPVI|nr:uncharacterized protein Aspvir_009897 [Aspergillus viridinutans]GIK05784.1 hypothetical protein Aspvir_009897 [Aspergillus viridinutans]
MSLPWKRLIRFRALDGRILRGEPILPAESTINLGLVTEADQLQASIIQGQDIYDTTGKTKVTDEVVTVKQILSPLAPSDVPIPRCVGLNYAKHIKEVGRKPPPFPFIFFKPNTCVNDHGEPVVIPRIAQDDQADYEGELVCLTASSPFIRDLLTGLQCLVIGKDAKDVPVERALEYVAAYTAGNDISSRKLQRDPAYAGTVPQWGFSKGFHTFAPLGPVLVAASEIPDPS